MYPLTQPAMEVLRLGREEHEFYRIIGKGRPLKVAEYHQGFWAEPVSLNDTRIDLARNRIKRILTHTAIDQIIYVEEAPLLLSGYRGQRVYIDTPAEESKRIISKVLAGTLALGAATALFLSVFAFTLPVVGALIGLLFVPAIDPAVLIRLPDSTYIEVLRWYHY